MFTNLNIYFLNEIKNLVQHGIILNLTHLILSLPIVNLLIEFDIKILEFLNMFTWADIRMQLFILRIILQIYLQILFVKLSWSCLTIVASFPMVLFIIFLINLIGLFLIFSEIKCTSIFLIVFHNYYIFIAQLISVHVIVWRSIIFFFCDYISFLRIFLIVFITVLPYLVCSQCHYFFFIFIFHKFYFFIIILCFLGCWFSKNIALTLEIKIYDFCA